MLELRELRNFVAVAECLNITSAANAVNLSQPALSRQIQALEKKLGVALFERVGKRLVLTAEGADFAAQASELLERAQDLMHRARQSEPEQSGALRIGASPQTTAWLLSPAMARFRKIHPKVDLMVNEGNNDELVEMVEHGAVHMVVANLGISNILVGQPLFTAQLFAVLPPAHRCATMTSITIDDIATEPMMVMRRGFLTRHLFEQTAAAHGVRPRIVLESDSTQTLAALAHDGHGVAIVSSSAQNITDIANAVQLSSGICQTSAEVSALWNPRRYRPAYVQRFFEALVDVARERGLTVGAEKQEK
ncbi:LysR family transcriptional regulator [Rhodobium gokarnense]|uniref:DNA-binding transcriptional LysR family regulator n=1 Tax=Rhodobium gokarnense TaxID=364296 RepID=A0ABT3HGS2_9HYPH|nr:LysR family transcriptional regulator [Rhodobium gokarnense]MCW2309587.1 DNA-binding transcriptional LysR family regulator [Rhodobium gokarnense]